MSENVCGQCAYWNPLYGGNGRCFCRRSERFGEERNGDERLDEYDTACDEFVMDEDCEEYGKRQEECDE